MIKKFWFCFMRFFRTCLTVLGRPFGIALTDETWIVWEQFIKFILVGISNAVVTLLVYNGIVLAFGTKCYLIAQTIGYIAGIFNSYFWNSRFVFSVESGQKEPFIKMCICYGMTYLLQIGLLYSFVEWLQLSTFLSPVLAIIITTPVNFIINRLWTFRQNK
ncbi:GtrA family protein [Oscillibacter sp.]|uniref:GtrA family protein n=1 Tax=Oscillibacter sp. TaxID=1945593 RepID=UPI00289FC3E9|nr:GtrA family protein [Oscillibacter sp.]